MTIKVIGAGFGRTGTMSLKLALEQLGVGPCYHMVKSSRSRKRQICGSLRRMGILTGIRFFPAINPPSIGRSRISGVS